MQADSPSSVRIAVLIDADNTSPKFAEALLDEIARDGNPTIRRVYGDWSSTHLAGWTRKLNPLGLQAMHQHALTTRKNSTDSAMIIDAMDLLYADNVEGFALVSSDCDFASLAMRLRAGGKFVHGMGEAKTPAGFANACDKFVHLETLGEDEVAAEPVDAEAAEEEPGALPTINLQSALTKAVNAQSGDDGWARLGPLGQHLRRTHPSFNTRSFGHENLSSLVKELPYLLTTGEGNDTLIQLKGKQSARKATKSAAPAEKKAAKAAAPAVKKTAKSAAPAEKAPAVKRTTRSARAAKPAVEPTAPPQEEPQPPATPAKPTVTVTTRTRGAKKVAPKD
ncbi:NYN domain-containing protein [Nocardioides sp.]|uniref:NYN domain-containing protein n=1 Tax=Nocardioides sp. TaxID=35761 RepID=UPI002CAFD3D5|nr:NYN domain-containing protein [Nocardioides sp.]HXH79017.1 NYN domain-containing protein [Nocardioides sp.]